MPTISGVNQSITGQGTPLFSPPPASTPIIDKDGKVNYVWQRWFNEISSVKTTPSPIIRTDIDGGYSAAAYTLDTTDINGGSATTHYTDKIDGGNGYST